MDDQSTDNQSTDNQSTDGQERDAPNARRRFFNRAERFVLHAAAGGRCEECGTSLDSGFHADHQWPYAAGGLTDLANAQALCPDCNRRKGARVNPQSSGSLRSVTVSSGATAEGPVSSEVTAEGPVSSGALQQEEPAGTRSEPAGTSQGHTSSLEVSGLEVSGLESPISGGAGRDPQASPSAVPNIPASLPLPPWTRPLRAWQQRGADAWRNLRQQGGRDLTITATPGSGKTELALFLAAEEIQAGRADLLVVVVPTRALKEQWAHSAHRAGLRLTAGWGNGAVALPADVHGCCVTYAQIAALPEALRLLSSRRRVIAVLDEVHHCAASRVWGDALFQALEHAEARLCLSGTAWREDGAMIPFVHYDAQGRSVSDVAYSYPEALADGVVRDAYFFALGARVLWLGERGEQSATFADVLGERDRARRLRAALHAGGGWLDAAIVQADTALTAARAGHPAAKGLAVAMNGAHARAVAGRLERLTGVRPSVALSDDPQSLLTLAQFRSGPGRWLVVCRMAGEGYDCRDLRVVLWATNLTGELAFRQIVARALRVVPGLVHQDAQVFLPADERLLSLARGLVGGGGGVPRAGGILEAEELEAEEEEDRDDAERSRLAGARSEGDRMQANSLFVALTSRATEQSVVTGGLLLPASALQRARALNGIQSGQPLVPDHAVAAALAREEAGTAEPAAGAGQEGMELEGRDPESSASVPMGQVSRMDQVSGSASQTETDNQTYDQRRQELRGLCTRLTALIARELDVNPSLVHQALRRSLGVRQAEATLAELAQRKRMLEDKLRELRVG